MLLRWLIRSLCIAIVLVCALAWSVSYFRTPYIEYGNPVGSLGCGMIDGGLYLVAEERGTPGWNSGFENARTRPDSAPFYFLSFNAGHDAGTYFLRIPCWFLTTFSLLFLWLLWRKTRPRQKPSAFPIDLTPPPT